MKRLRPDERALVATAGGVFALASAGAAMSAAAADGMFLAEIGSAHLGEAVAASSALLAVVLAVVGGMSDRLDRRRVLASLAVVSAVVVAALAGLSVAAPRVAAIATLVGGKQLAAATDLAFWIVIAERVDARRSQRVLPILAAVGGLGATAGAWLVVPVAAVAGARGVLVAAAVLLAIAGAGASRLVTTRRVGAMPARLSATRGLIARSWRDGARAVSRHALARHLAVVVAAAGVFASLAYMALGVAVAARGGDPADLASLLGIVRGSGQLVTLVVQLAIAPWLLARVGTGRALLVAPIAAVAAGIGLVAAPVLAAAIAAQMSARVLDASVETPAEKLAQTLLPTAVRGRVAGFLDGTAKRAGAVLGGLIAAGLAGAPGVFYVVMACAGAAWLLAAWRIARELPALAIERVSNGDTSSAASDAADAVGGGVDDAVVDDRAVAMLARELTGTRPERAAEVLVRLHERSRFHVGPRMGSRGAGWATLRRWGGAEGRGFDAAGPLAQAAIARGGPIVWRALVAVLDEPAPSLGPGLLEAAIVARERDRELAVRAVGLAGGVPADALDRWRAAGARADARADGESRSLDRGETRGDLRADVGGGSRRVDGSDQPSADAGAAAGDAFARSPLDPGLALAAEVASLRLAGDDAEILATLGDAVREPDVENGARAVPVRSRSTVAIDELVAEAARGLAGRDSTRWGSLRDSTAPDLGDAAADRTLDVARLLARAVRRRRGETPSRAGAIGAIARIVASVRDLRSAELALLRADLLELARERVDDTASATAPPDRLVSLMRAPDHVGDAAPETAAALRLYGVLLEGADAALPEDLRRIAQALGEPDDDVRAAAEAALVGLGPAATGELIATAAWGRRRARDRAAALLADLPVTPVTIDRLVDAELDALDQTATAIAVMTEPGDELVARRLDERLREIAHTVLLLVAARRRSPSIAAAATAWRHARGGHERARALAVIEAALPRALVGRLVDAVDDLSPADREAGLARAGAILPARDAVIRVELGGRDRLARALVMHAIGAAGRSAHRDTIARAAHDEVAAASPHDLIRRLTSALDHDEPPALAPDPDMVDEGNDMPTRVETLIALGRVPLLAALTTRQLADVAERARWVTARAGVLCGAGEPIDALIVVDDGELELAGRRIGKGEVVDELACVAPAIAETDLRVVRPVRVIRLERVDFEELVDDVPGLAAAVCRALGERARRAEDATYRSPLATRG